MAKTKKEQAKEMLRLLDPWKKITEKLGTGGSIYDALTEYLKTDAAQIYNAHKREIEILKNEKPTYKQQLRPFNTKFKN